MAVQPDNRRFDFDYIVIGSGFGGSVSAFRLTEKGYRVAVMEMGRRWTPANLPKTGWDLKNWIWRPALGLRGFFNMRIFRHAVVLHGCAVGGGSITYANTMLKPPREAWQNGPWKGLADWEAELAPHFNTAEKMLGVVENRIVGPGDRILQRTADATGTGKNFYKTRVAVFQPGEGEESGTTFPDPYFGGEGPERATCTACGGCMMGCRFNAKNTLDKNYLFLAEKRGARVFAETKAVDVRPVNGAGDGGGGYEVSVERRAGLFRAEGQTFTCRGVVFAASALGTMELLFTLKERGSLPGISGALGREVRTNAESLVGIRIPDSREDLSQGVAIGSGVHITDQTNIEAVRYPQGADTMALVTTLMTGGAPGRSRVLPWLANLLRAFLKNPLLPFRLVSPFRWARETVIFLCMHTLDYRISMTWKRNWWWPFQKMLSSHGPKIPAYIPAANDFTFKAAELEGGTAMSMASEILFNIPTTAHILGGCTMASSREEGVIDHRHRVFGYRNMYVCDSSAVSANLGVNPSLTICALTERAMGFIPNNTGD